jgi:D-sedoheptulose 7-phosphate isomerase
LPQSYTTIMTTTITTTMPAYAAAAIAYDIPSYLEELSATIQNLPVDDINRLACLFLEAYQRGRTIYLFGNGGSASLASHMSCDLGKGTAPASGKRLRAVALTDNLALITAWANDTRYEKIFAEQLENLLEPGDVAFAISASGNSPNIIAALQFARQAGVVTAGISGFEGGKMKSLCDVCVVVPSGSMQIIEDLHLSIAHLVFHALRHKICEINRPAADSSLRPSIPKHRAASAAG